MSSPEIEILTEEQFNQQVRTTSTDLISSALGGKIHSFSDEFFAAAENLIKPTPPVSHKGEFIASGAVYDGWETRRHNPEPYDWVIIALGVPSGTVAAVEIDTAFFTGNHAPAISVAGANTAEITPTTSWETVIPTTECSPSSRHFLKLKNPTHRAYTHVKLCMYPDGGIARFRLYGNVVPVWPADVNSIVDLASVSNGGLAVARSDEHFGTASNLLLPGRGVNMGDGWETKRSRGAGHVDWVIVKLGHPGYLEEIIVDTLHFRGNFPQAVEVYAIDAEDTPAADDARWKQVVERTKCEKDKEHAFPSSVLKHTGERFTHVKMVIIPDGGVKRLRVFGKRAI